MFFREVMFIFLRNMETYLLKKLKSSLILNMVVPIVNH